MALHTGYSQKEKSKTDLSDILKRLTALETLTSSHTTKIAANNTSIITNGNCIQTNKNEIASNYTYSASINTKVTANGAKLATKVSHMENFELIYENPTYNVVQYPAPHRPGHPIGWLPMNHVNDTTQVSIDFHIFDDDTDLSTLSDLNILYRLDVAKQSGNPAYDYTFPLNNLKTSTKTITKQIYNPKIAIDLKTAFPTIYNEIKCFRIVFTPKTSGLSGNESRIYLHVQSH